jgi:RND family efflux transporter MFP subunit
LDAAQTSYASTEQKVSADLLSVYDGTVTALQSAVVNAKNALITLADIQEAHFDNFDQESGRVAQDKAAIVEALLGESSSGYWEAEFISDLDDGLFGEVKALNGEPDTEKIDVNVIRTLDMLSLLRDALNGVPIKAEMTATEKASLTTEKTTISAEITTISSKEQSVAVQRAINESTMKTAEASVTTAQNTLSAARDQLALKQSGNTAESVVTQEARIRAQIASVSLYQTQIAKSTLRTPIDGSVTTQDAKVGVVVSAGAPLVSVMSSGNYEIEAYIPEADITKVDLDDMAIVTLDAYTDDTELTARVIRIDPAETVIEGVPTYKTTLVIDEGAELVKSGMTANIDVVTQIREDVLNIPTRAVVTEDGERFVRNVDALGEVQMLPITTGLRGSDGHIEILEGLEEGQEIITFMSR